MDIALILQAILLTSDKPLSRVQLLGYFDEGLLTQQALNESLDALVALCEHQSFELVETASGFRLQTRAAFQPWVLKHSIEKPAKYSKALLETLALIAWRQPITRAEIESIRGVAVNSFIIKTLQERDWIRVVGHKDVVGRPELLGTTRQFLDYFGLKSLSDLPEMKALLPASPLTV